MLECRQGYLAKRHPRMSTIDRTKHYEDIAERMIGGARLDRTSHPNPRETEHTAEDRPQTDRRSREERKHR